MHAMNRIVKAMEAAPLGSEVLRCGVVEQKGASITPPKLLVNTFSPQNLRRNCTERLHTLGAKAQPSTLQSLYLRFSSLHVQLLLDTYVSVSNTLRNPLDLQRWPSAIYFAQHPVLDSRANLVAQQIPARMSSTSRPARSAYFTNWLDELLAVLAISYWVGSIVGQTLGTVIALCCLPNKIAVLFLAWQVGKRRLRGACVAFPLKSVIVQVFEVVRPVGATPRAAERYCTRAKEGIAMQLTACVSILCH